MEESADIKLVTRLLSDDISAFDELYWKYHQRVYLNILKITKDEDVSHDILQDVFVTLWEKRLTIDREQSVSGLIFVISFNKAVNSARKKLSEQNAQNKIASFPIIEDTREDHEAYEVQYQLLKEAVEQLSPQKRKVFTLCKLEGKSYEQVATELNISKYTVKEHLSLAMLSVKDYIRKHPDLWKVTATLLFIDFF